LATLILQKALFRNRRAGSYNALRHSGVTMRRRKFLALVGAAALCPTQGRAQHPGPLIGFVNAGSIKGYERTYAAFLKGLAESGYEIDRSVTIDARWADGHYESLPKFLNELVQRKVNLIAATSTPGAVAASKARLQVPVVFTTSGDPVQLGLVKSLSRPDANMTGASQLNVEVAPKRLELIHELLPAASSFGLLVNPNNPVAATVSRQIEAAAATLGLKLHVLRASTADDLTAAFETLVREQASGLVIGTDTFFNSQSEDIARLAIRHRVPTVYQYPEFTAAGGLMSYGGNVTESYRLAGGYAGRILKGAKPADLPVQRVTKVDLIINLKTAKLLGIDVPLQLVNRADEIIE
jgi:putative ABC transport system substrate-binding protein